jgi:hypothetical protein
MDAFTAHAIKCGIDLTGRKVLPTRVALRHWAAIDVLHPETQKPIVPAGWWISLLDVQQMEAAGVDYVVVDA